VVGVLFCVWEKVEWSEGALFRIGFVGMAIGHPRTGNARPYIPIQFGKIRGGLCPIVLTGEAILCIYYIPYI